MLEAAIAALNDGQVVGCPTDTVYGLGVDPFNDDAIALLYEIKGRPAGKPIGLLVSSLEQAREIGELSGRALALAREHWPGGLTLIVTPRVVMSDWVGHKQRRTIGLRMPDHETALDLLQRAGPLAVTSANRSGDPETLDDESAFAIFGDQVAAYVRGVCLGGVASTVVDATSDSLKVLRQGDVDLSG